MTEQPGAFGRESPPALTYEGYLGLGDLLSLQRPLSSPPDRDEMLFIVVHQVHELWFKLILWELDHAREAMGALNARLATKHVRRVTEIQRTILDALRVLETMASSDFLRFRDRLGPASGLQSVQFREIEVLCGVAPSHRGTSAKGSLEALARLRRRQSEPSLEETFYTLLRRRGFDVPERGNGPEEERRARATAALLPIYQRPEEHPDLFDLAESLISFDEGLALWRLHHVTMAERMIGAKVGTGGTAGVGYLKTTLWARAFPDLWALRTELAPGYGGGGK
jgi:tryptophan 2,3-dioxygenase